MSYMQNSSKENGKIRAYEKRNWFVIVRGIVFKIRYESLEAGVVFISKL